MRRRSDLQALSIPLIGFKGVSLAEMVTCLHGKYPAELEEEETLEILEILEAEVAMFQEPWDGKDHIEDLFEFEKVKEGCAILVVAMKEAGGDFK
jgi:hypothetical protein